jgi:hypothetical protein
MADDLRSVAYKRVRKHSIYACDTLALATDRPRDVHHVLSLHGEGGSLVFRKLFNLFSTIADVQFTVTNVS